MYRTLADLPEDIRKTLSPVAQNTYRRAFNVTGSHSDALLLALGKDLGATASGPGVTAGHIDTPLGSKRPKRKDLVKSDTKRYTLGVVYEPDAIDTQDDFATAEEIERACWDFNRGYIGTGKSLTKGALGIQHNSWDDSHGEIVESYIAPCDMVINHEPISKGTWLMGVIWSPSNWEKVLNGEMTGLSMGGRAKRIVPNSK